MTAIVQNTLPRKRHPALRAQTKDGKTVSVRCYCRFSMEIDGATFRFAVTDELQSVGHCVTHVDSGLRVKGLGVGATYLPRFAKLRGDSYKARAMLALEELVTQFGAAHVREVIETRRARP